MLLSDLLLSRVRAETDRGDIIGRTSLEEGAGKEGEGGTGALMRLGGKWGGNSVKSESREKLLGMHMIIKNKRHP